MVCKTSMAVDFPFSSPPHVSCSFSYRRHQPWRKRSVFLAKQHRRGVRMLGFAFCFLFLSSAMCWQAWYSWKSRKSPLAVITSEGIYLPFKRPDYVAWDEMQAVGAFYLKGTAFLDLTLNDPRRTFGRRREWWQGPWRDRVTLRIESTSNPLLQAARDAHNRSVVTVGA